VKRSSQTNSLARSTVLEAAYYGGILRWPELHDHLSQSADTVPYAGACRAVTSRISASRAQTLAGLVTAGLADAVSKPDAAARVWTLGSGGVTAVHTVDVGSVRSASVAGWTIRLPRDLEERILHMRGANLPVETGGVLFGLVDLVKCRIDLVEAWPAPSGSTGSETEFIRGTKGLRQEVEKAISRTLEQVRYVGEWHSHPRRARTRPTDLCQLGWLAATLSMDGCPGLMLIAGDKGVSINLGEVIEEVEARAQAARHPSNCTRPVSLCACLSGCRFGLRQSPIPRKNIAGPARVTALFVHGNKPAKRDPLAIFA
jgi:hypothetical protein